MLRLILEYGEQTISDAGINCLGFPGTLITHKSEAIEIETYLASPEENDV
ncbi:unnamed protein product [marine sediment metagenome]|uniref:Uncharacterized protein n=1 Tax=marine sediment metagenome TaxID=412755 RepID=X1B6L2_9ZZZZ